MLVKGTLGHNKPKSTEVHMGKFKLFLFCWTWLGIAIGVSLTGIKAHYVLTIWFITLQGIVSPENSLINNNLEKMF